MIDLQHHFGGGVYAKEHWIPSGQILIQHKHKHDHLSILASGTVELMVDGVRSEVTGPACLTIKAGQHHGVKSLTDVVWYCIHATDETDESEIDHELVQPANQEQMTAMITALKEY